MFPWLSNVALSFDIWFPQWMRIVYVPRCGTLISGRVAMAFDYDVTDDDSTISFVTLMQMKGAVSMPVYSSRTLEYNSSSTVMAAHKYFCETTNQDRLASPARLLIMCESTTSGPMGDVFAEYGIRLLDPEPVLNVSAPSLRVATTDPSSPTPNSPFGPLESLHLSTCLNTSHNVWESVNNVQDLVSWGMKFKGRANELLGAFTPTSDTALWLRLFRPLADATSRVYFVLPPYLGTVRIRFTYYCRLVLSSAAPVARFVCNYPYQYVSRYGIFDDGFGTYNVIFNTRDATSSIWYDNSTLHDVPDVYGVLDISADVKCTGEASPCVFTVYFEGFESQHQDGFRKFQVLTAHCVPLGYEAVPMVPEPDLLVAAKPKPCRKT